MKGKKAFLSAILRNALPLLPLLLAAHGCSSSTRVAQNQNPSSQCSLTDCNGLAATDEAKLCSDGTAVGRSVCATKSDGTCFWDFPACPSGNTPSSCTMDECAGLPVTKDAKICPGGGAVGRTLCNRNASGQCFWDFPPCPAVDAGTMDCTLADCQGKPVQEDAKLCPDGTGLGRTVCARNALGVCNWDFPACPPTAATDAGCGCVPDMKWGANGGLVAYQDDSFISACFTYKHARTSYFVDAGNQSCTETLLGCGSGLRSGRDIVTLLDRPDVQQAIAAMKIVYGTDPRAFDGTVLRIEVKGAIIDVGSPCMAGGCLAIPAGVSMLAEELRAIDAQELGFEPCKSAFPAR